MEKPVSGSEEKPVSGSGKTPPAGGGYEPNDPSKDTVDTTTKVQGKSDLRERPQSPAPSVPVQDDVHSPSPPPPPPKDEKYITSHKGKERAEAVDEEKEALKAAEAEPNGDEVFDDSQSEIQSIMDQFEDGMGGPGPDEIMSPRMEIASPLLGSGAQHPPRKSSLEPLSTHGPPISPGETPSIHTAMQSPPPRSSSLTPSSPVLSLKRQSISHELPESPISPPATRHIPPPPQPDPEPDLPFDFHRFLEQLRHRTADPVAKYLRSFLLEFGKKQWMVHEQVKIISDFLEFITKKMAQCEVWRTVSDAEFDNAREGMEKLVMNRLYTQTFSPAIPAPEPVRGKGRRRGQGASDPAKPGRRGQHQEDVERDEVLAQKVRIYGWIKEEHLDIPPVGEKGKKFLTLAQQELSKINSYRAPRDKVICILNCCKVIFGFLRNAQHDQSADSFIPLLIYIVLQANPDHLVSNVQYILHFRNQDKLGGEAGYYISSLMGAIQFIENLDRTSLTVSDADFEKNVEAAVSAIAERHSMEEQRHLAAQAESDSKQRSISPHLAVSEKSTISRPEVTPRNSLDAERSLPHRGHSRNPSANTSFPRSDDEAEPTDNAAVAGLLRTIQRPLSTIGRMFSDDAGAADRALDRDKTSLASPVLASTPRGSDEVRRSAETRRGAPSPGLQPPPQLSDEQVIRQASMDTEEARKVRLRKEGHLVERLCGMFPDLDREIIADVVREKEGRVEQAVDACLALSG
ncbi:hypothetical protein EJ06DRAFT_533821 [Trichodelitschia bisporula]|uniref:Guanine nucleotide exchange factor Vps9 n=1 Tax=Trichodelitschia bisporula TaxID=703511 RepID=A0A6G1HKP3_9PEZI|nr:hypothetical protein EJ06DRAFT_533821 [Trichodelitschia bisporula]